MVGSASTVNVTCPLPLSGLVTVIVRLPIGAPAAIVMLMSISLGPTNIVLFTLIPVPENVTVAPLTKLLPVITTSLLVAPRGRALGDAASADGARAIVMWYVCVAV